MIGKKEVDQSINEVIKRSFKSKNPYRDKEFAENIRILEEAGVKQLELKNELLTITTGINGEFLRNKVPQIDKKIIVKGKVHGIDHNNRVAIMSMIIAANEGILKEDSDNKIKDLLISAAYYHDIGRQKWIFIDNFGPHSKNSVKRLKKSNLDFLKTYTEEEKNILYSMIEAHEGVDDDIKDVLCKYKIPETQKERTTYLIKILKDADALDRVRTDKNNKYYYKTDLNQKYLRTNTSKKMLILAYQLENLTNEIEFEKILLYKLDEIELVKSAI